MSKKLLYILLLISLAFNMAFIGSFLYWHTKVRHTFAADRAFFEQDRYRRHQQRNMHRDPMEQPPPPGLRPGDMGWVGNREIIEPFRNRFIESKTEFYKELQRPVFNETTLKQKLDASLVNHTELEKQIGTRLIEMRKKMTPKEADQFFGRHTMRSMRRDYYEQDQPNEKRRNK